MRTVVVVPTYQEAGNVGRFLAAVRNAAPDAQVVVVDDNSPDGTAKLAEEAAEDLGGVEVLVRQTKEGLGNAYRHGFGHVLDQGFDVVVQMDCDFSHDPAVIPDLVAALADGADCAIGSRYVTGGSTPGWPWHRRALSRYGNRYTSTVLRLGIRDATGGFRAYRADTLRHIHIETTQANGYAFLSEVALRMVRAGMELVELPITFVDRECGTSKMSVPIMAESLSLITRWGLRDLFSGACAGPGRARPTG
ncbi:MAG: polyprenol monophosphomannose synthase [Acidimicrobiales bacterium]